MGRLILPKGECVEFSLLDDEPVTGPDDDSLGTGRAAREPAELVHPRAPMPHGSSSVGPAALLRYIDDACVEIRQPRS